MRTAEAPWMPACGLGLLSIMLQLSELPAGLPLSSKSPDVEVLPWVNPETLFVYEPFFSPVDLQGFGGEKKIPYVLIL